MGDRPKGFPSVKEVQSVHCPSYSPSIAFFFPVGIIRNLIIKKYKQKHFLLVQIPQTPDPRLLTFYNFQVFYTIRLAFIPTARCVFKSLFSLLRSNYDFCLLIMSNQQQKAVGTFLTRQDAEEALLELRNAGFNMDKISAIAKDPSDAEKLADVEVKSSSERAKEGAETRAMMGAATGGILGLIGSFSVLAIPAVGIATEVAVLLGNTLLGTGMGAAGGSIVGALIGWGIPEKEAEYYSELLSQGSYVILVEGTRAEISGAEAILLNRQIQNWNIYHAPNHRNFMGI